MKLAYLLAAIVALFIQDPASEGKRWWSHIEFLADDALEGRNVGTPGFEKALVYVEGRFKDIGLKPMGLNGYRLPVKLESRVLVPEQSTLAIVRNGQEEALTVGEDASLSARGELDGWMDAPMVFVGYGTFAASIRSHVISRPRVLRWMRRAFAGAFVALGARLALADR